MIREIDKRAKLRGGGLDAGTVRVGAPPGFTLVEAFVASVLVSLVILAIAKIITGGMKSLAFSRQATTAASLAQMIDARVKSLPFHDVFSYNSLTPAVVIPASSALVLSFNPATLTIPRAVSRSSHTLIFLQNEVVAKGFSHFTLTVTFLRRDSSDQAGTGELVEDYVAWSSADANGCDDVDPALCFRNCPPLDGQYWGFCSDGKPEVPDTGLKMITVSVHKKEAKLAVKHGTFITKAGLTGAEIPVIESPLKLNVTYPLANYTLIQAQPNLIPHLEYKSILDYPPNWYGWNGTNKVIRIDDNQSDVTIYQNVDGNPKKQKLTQGTQSYFRLKGWTEPGAELEIYDMVGGAVPSLTQTPLQVINSSPNGVFDHQAQLGPLSGSMETAGSHIVWTRAKNGAFFSPYDRRRTYTVDITPPWVSTYGPVGQIYTLSPTIFLAPTADGSSGWGSEYIRAMKVLEDKVVHPSTTVTQAKCNGCAAPTGQFRLQHFSNSVQQYHGGTSVMGAGIGGSWEMLTLGPDTLPPVWEPGKTYRVLYEFGDAAMYKSSKTWTFTTPTQDMLNADTTAPDFIPRPGSGVFNGVGTPTPWPWHDATHASTWTMRNTTGGTADLVTFKYNKVRDLESGINFKTFKMELCDADLTPTNCIVFYSSSTDNGASGLDWNQITYENGADGIPGADLPRISISYDSSRLVRIRTSVKNWAGLEGVKDDWYIYVSTFIP